MARVLVADDNAQLVELLRATLEDAGHDVVTAYSGLAAAGLIEREELDLVVLDVLMPQMSGDAVADFVARVKPGIPVLLMTGDSGEQFIQSKAMPRLRKPFAPQELTDAVERLLAAH